MQHPSFDIRTRSLYAVARLGSVLVLVFAHFTLPTTLLGQVPERPNVILIMADDLGWMDLHVQGNQQLDTPVLDRFAQQGMRFPNGYAASPVCTPTRAAIMTGQTPARLNITNHAPGNPDHVGESGLKGAKWDTYLSLEAKTLAEHLKEAGYATGFVGKWHLSHRPGEDAEGKLEPRLRPEHQGFNVNIGGCRFGGPPTYFDPYRIPNIAPRKTGEYLTDREAAESISFMQSQKDKPFFLCWWSYGVHYPFEAPADLVKKYEGRDVPNAKYAAQIEALDRSIGSLLGALDSDPELAKNTIVIFTSDNGSFLSNAPLRLGKGYLYEGGIRVPWFIRWPGTIAPESTCADPVISTDLFPTILDLAGASLPADEPCDGVSLVPALKGHSLERTDLYFHYPNYAFHKENRLGCAIRSGKHKLIHFFADDSVELYDLEADLAEANDLSKLNPQLATELKGKLDAWRGETQARMPTRDAKAYKVTLPPASMELPDFYQKFVSANGYPIVGSARVDDYALKEAAYLIDMLLAKRADLRRAMIDNQSRMIVMAHDEFTTDIPEYRHMKPKDFWDARARGLGGSRTDPVCSSAEENLLAYPGDPYSTENILIHEFAHNLHLRGLVKLDPTFDTRLRQCYDRAMANGLWKGKYASVNKNEYFAEGVQSWFNNNRPPDHDHNHVDTREELIEYDPGLGALCKEVFGDTELVYSSPLSRLEGHLEGYDPSQAPRFRWPERLNQAKKQIIEDARNRSKE